MTRTSSPILWYGDLVDFGTYSTAVATTAKDAEITFSFVIDNVTLTNETYWTDDGPISSQESEHKDVEFDVVIGRSGSAGERTSVQKLRLSSGDPAVVFELEVGEQQRVTRIKIDGVDVLNSFVSPTFQIVGGSILPELFFVTSDTATRAFQRRRRDDGEIARVLSEFIRPFLPKNFPENALVELSGFLLSTRALTPESLRMRGGRTSNKRWNKFINEITDTAAHPVFLKVRNIIAVVVLADLLRRVDQQLRGILSGVLYIGPARARSERYYRYQDLSVSEIDPDGKNFPMFLNSLTYLQVQKLSSWIESLFGYGVSVRREGGHISIDLIARGNISNIVDTGYGVSQILPVLGQIWWARSRPQTAATRQAQVSVLAIEQPELHLHPAHQALLADALVGEVGLTPEYRYQPESRINFIVETHSETLVNRLGELINAGRLNHADVQIVLFEPDATGAHVTTTRTSSFNQSGELIDWPYGFFQPNNV